MKGESLVGKKWSLHRAWFILATCFVNVFINFSVRLGFSVILPEMIKDLGLSRTAGASIYNSQIFMYLTMAPLTGYLADRFGARRVITICTFILSAGIFLMGRVESFGAACLSYAIVGIGATGIWTPALMVLQRWFAPHRKGLALGILSTGYGLGLATMGIVFPWIVNNYNWRYSWYLYGTMALIMVGVNGLLMRSDPESAGLLPWGQKEPTPLDTTEGKAQTAASSLSNVFKYRTFWLIGISYFSVAYGLYGITTFMVDYAKFQIGLPLAKASLLATIHGACQVVGVLTIVPFSDYLGRKKTILISNSFITAAIIGILLSGNSLIALYMCIGILAVFYGATFPLYGASAGDFFPKEVMGTVIGAWSPFQGLGMISVHWVSGILRDTTGSYGYSFMLSMVMAALSVLFISTVGKVDRTGLSPRIK